MNIELIGAHAFTINNVITKVPFGNNYIFPIYETRAHGNNVVNENFKEIACSL
jgi:hypothetical protein